MKKMVCILLIILSISLIGCTNKKVEVDSRTPEETVKLFYQALENKNQKLRDSVATDNAKWNFDNFQSIKLIEIGNRHEDSEKAYMDNGRGTITKPNDVRVYDVIYDIAYSKNMEYPASEDDGRAYKQITLIKEKEDSFWLVDSIGQP
ncbi:MAG: DUF4829 domain-containing protein [Clostridiaceae bacterium]